MTSELFDLLCRVFATYPDSDVDYCFMRNGENPQPVKDCSYDETIYTKSAGRVHRGSSGGSRKNVGGNGAGK